MTMKKEDQSNANSVCEINAIRCTPRSVSQFDYARLGQESNGMDPIKLRINCSFSFLINYFWYCIDNYDSNELSVRFFYYEAA